MIHEGDLFDVLPTLDAESIDACVTDPPYGIGFMGREWDTFKPGTGKHRKLMHPRERVLGKIISDNPNINGRSRSPALSPSQIDYDYTAAGLRGFQQWTTEWAAEVLRVLKPGAYLVVCGAPRSHHRMMCGLEDAGFVMRDCFAWLFGSGFPKNFNLGDGKGTALKPAHEPIALAWKPFKGTISACHEKHGTAALNIDACLIGTTKDVPASGTSAGSVCYGKRGPRTTDMPGFDPNRGRWPANVLLDEETAAMLDEQTGELVSGANPTRRGVDKFRGIYSDFKGQETCDQARGAETGGASRFYYIAKPSREERDFGCDRLDAFEPQGVHPGTVNTTAKSGVQQRFPHRNTHPTVKPVELMRWLVRLVTPPDGVVLDPFMGSGTTGMACRYEHRRFIGIEREADYARIAEARIAAVAPLFAEEKPA